MRKTRWRVGTRPFHTAGGELLREIFDGYPDEPDEATLRFVCIATPGDAEQIVSDHNAHAALAAENGALRASLAEHRSVMFAMLTPMMDGSERQRAKDLLARPSIDAAPATPAGEPGAECLCGGRENVLRGLPRTDIGCPACDRLP